MTGPEHYLAAEKLIARVTTGDGTLQPGDHTAELVPALVHAVLALAAATGLDNDSAQWAAWREAAGA